MENEWCPWLNDKKMKYPWINDKGNVPESMKKEGDELESMTKACIRLITNEGNAPQPITWQYHGINDKGRECSWINGKLDTCINDKGINYKGKAPESMTLGMLKDQWHM